MATPLSRILAAVVAVCSAATGGDNKLADEFAERLHKTSGLTRRQRERSTCIDHRLTDPSNKLRGTLNSAHRQQRRQSHQLLYLTQSLPSTYEEPTYYTTCITSYTRLNRQSTHLKNTKIICWLFAWQGKSLSMIWYKEKILKCTKNSHTGWLKKVSSWFYADMSMTRKPCCRKETARCCSCSFQFKVRRRHSLQVEE